jgi:hypothetical protein
LKERVQGNRHIAGCLNHFESNSHERKPGISPFKQNSKLAKSKKKLGSGYKAERDFRDIQDEKQNY